MVKTASFLPKHIPFLGKKQVKAIEGKNRVGSKMVHGRLILINVSSSLRDRIWEMLGRAVSLRLISGTRGDPANGNRGIIGEAVHLDNVQSAINWATESGEVNFHLTFDWDDAFGIPGAFVIKNRLHTQFYLKSMTIYNIPGHGQIHFDCNSWVYPLHRYSYDRVFFSNETFIAGDPDIPGNTPVPLQFYREQELIHLRGNGSGKLKEWDRVYDYAYYNDLGMPDKGPEYARPVLGGSKEYPYPRRGRTGRPPTKADPNTESRLPLLSLNFYVPRDETFSNVKMSEFLAHALQSIGQLLVPEMASIFERNPNEFDSFEDVLKLYTGEFGLPNEVSLKKVEECLPFDTLKELLRSDGERFLKFPMPSVIKVDETAWRTDEEFAREMLAGLNPVVIRRLQEFPPASKLDPEVYGNQNSTITREHVHMSMDQFTIDQAIVGNKIFILDHHDSLMPYLRRINTTTTKTYASRTLLYLQDDGTLKPIAIELSLPHEQGGRHGCTSKVFTPAEEGVEGSVWQLAKAYVAVNDSGYHQLISHWLNTHCVIEPFVIATHRQLSVLHPLHKLLHPHFRDTMYVNGLARQILINAGGILENTVFPSKYAMEMSSAIYKNWNFTEQGLPADLLKRGIALPDSNFPHGLRLLIEDYPYAVDGLDIWSAIQAYVQEYCSYYYPEDQSVQSDREIQAWWTEIRTKGHEDKKDEPWWPKMQTQAELIQSCTIIMWVASALHAAVNFGQYDYAGYLPNRPAISRRFMPEPGTYEYAELALNPDEMFLKTITGQFQTLLGVSLIEILSRHTEDEIYIGQRESADWTNHLPAQQAFDTFTRRMVELELRIMGRNRDDGLRNRIGPAIVPYTLLYPSTSNRAIASGLSGMGVPNSVSM